MSFTNPAPSGKEGRTDQGVDWSGITGPIKAVADGIVTNIYPALSGFGYTIIEKLNSGGGEVYYGLETGGTPIGLSTGQTLKQGQAVAQGNPLGGIEVGFWDPTTGRSAGAPDYMSEGTPTPAGKRFRSAINGGPVATGTGSQTNLGLLWVEAGGDPKLANLMAAIAMAESSGNIGATNKNTNGSIDRGLWQINSVHSQFDANRLLTDPLYNAQAAVSVYKSQGLTAWSTYNNGAYKQFTSAGTVVPTNYGGPNGGRVRPGGGSGSGSGGSGGSRASQNYEQLAKINRTASSDSGFLSTIESPFKWYWGNLSGSFDNLENSVAAPVDDIVDAGEATVTAAQETVRFMENLPWYTLRATELVVGLTMMYLGLQSSFQFGRQSPTLSSTGAGIRRVTRELGAATPLGRAQRMARGRRAGRYEGETEHARLQARRETRQRLSVG